MNFLRFADIVEFDTREIDDANFCLVDFTDIDDDLENFEGDADVVAAGMESSIGSSECSCCGPANYAETLTLNQNPELLNSQ